MSANMKIPAIIHKEINTSGIHARACKHCPSVVGPSDPESEWISTLTYEQRLETAFGCGWRQEKFCKGYCDKMGLKAADLP